VAEAGRAIIERYNACAPGTQFDVQLSGLAAGLRMWLLEAGARHVPIQEDDGSWRLSLRREPAPAQGSVPGLHHVVADTRGSLWACERAHRVARIDCESNQVAASREVARKASHLGLDERSARIFVADAEGNEIVALRGEDLGEIARWRASGTPQIPLVTPEGVVCVTGAETGTVTIAWPSGSAYRSKTFEVGACPHDPASDRSGEHLFVPCAGEGTVVKVRIADGSVLERMPVGDGPSHLAFDEDRERLYCANSWDGSVTCLTVDGQRLAQAYSGGWAHGIDLSPDGQRVYVANFLDDSVSVFDACSLAKVASWKTEPYPHGLDVSPDGRHVVATGFGSDHLRIFDTSLNGRVARIEVGWGSSHTAFAPNGTAWTACSISDHVARLDLASLSCHARVRGQLA
jgi:YVTN family beta-propeller protein